MRTIIIFLTIIVSLIHYQTEVSYAGDVIRCYVENGFSKLVMEGDSKFKLLTICGEPFDKQIKNYQTKSNYNSKSTTNYNKKHSQYDTETAGNAVGTTSVVEEWFYNCGKGRFNKLITIKDGEIISIKLEGRGTGKVKCE